MIKNEKLGLFIDKTLRNAPKAFPFSGNLQDM